MAESIIKFYFPLPYLNALSSFMRVQRRKKRMKIPEFQNANVKKRFYLPFTRMHIGRIIFSRLFLRHMRIVPTATHAQYFVNRLNKNHLNKMILMQAICLWESFYLSFCSVPARSCFAL